MAVDLVECSERARRSGRDFRPAGAPAAPCSRPHAVLHDFRVLRHSTTIQGTSRRGMLAGWLANN